MTFLGGDALPALKQDRLPLRGNEDTSKSLVASDVNAIIGALEEIRTAGVGSTTDASVFRAEKTGSLATAALATATINAAILAAYNRGGGTVLLPSGTILLDVAGPTVDYSIYMRDGVTLQGQGSGNTILKHKPDVVNGTNQGSVKMIREEYCSDKGCSYKGFTLDGGWDNGVAKVNLQSHLVTLPQSTIYFDDTSEMAASGSFQMITDSAVETITYGGRTATSLLFCSGGTALMRAGDIALKFDRGQKQTTVAVASNGVTLPATTTVTVADTTDFPASVSAGENLIRIFTSAGWQNLAYTSKTGTTLLGCSGATGTLATGALVQYIAGQGGQAASDPAKRQLDPKNNGIDKANTGNYLQPNKPGTIEDVRLRNNYGDAIHNSYSTSGTVTNSQIRLAARNGFTLTNATDVLKLRGVVVEYCGTTAIDAEPVESFANGVDGIDVTLRAWANSHGTQGNILMSISGGTVIRPAEWNYAKRWRFTHSDFYGCVYFSCAKGARFTDCFFSTDIGGTSYAPLLFEMENKDIKFTGCEIYGSNGVTSERNYGCVSVLPYRTATNSAGVSDDIVFSNTTIYPREGMHGVYIGANGGSDGATATATSYTAPANGVAGSLVCSGTPFAGKLDYFIGHRVVMGSAVGTCVGNTANTLYLSPVNENYTAPAKAWSDRRGLTAANPTLGTVTVLPTESGVTLQNVLIDCGRVDDKAAGVCGVKIDSTSTFNAGYTSLNVNLDNVTVRNATGAAFDFWLRGAAPGSSIRVVNCREQSTLAVKTCTVGFKWTAPENWGDIEFHGCKSTPGVLLTTGLDTALYWRSSSAHPPVYTGNVDPNGLVFAPKLSVYNWVAAGVSTQKQSIEAYSTGWTPITTAPYQAFRARSALVGNVTGNTAVSPGVAISVNKDVELLAVLRSGPTAVAFTQAGGFTQITGESSATYPTFAGVTMYLTLYYRQITGSAKVQPIIAAGASTQYFTKIFVVKDCVTTGSPIDNKSLSTDQLGALSFSVPGMTTTTDNCYIATILASFIGSSANGAMPTYVNGTLSELTKEVDDAANVGSDYILFGMVSGRQGAQGATGTLTGTLTASGGYAFCAGFTVALKPRID